MAEELKNANEGRKKAKHILNEARAAFTEHDSAIRAKDLEIRNLKFEFEVNSKGMNHAMTQYEEQINRIREGSAYERQRI